MTRDEALALIDTAVRNTARAAFRIWMRPAIQRVAGAVAFVVAVAGDEWALLENPPGPPKTEEELTIEAITEALRERGANGSAAEAARALAKNRIADRLPSLADGVRPPSGSTLNFSRRQSQSSADRAWHRRNQEERQEAKDHGGRARRQEAAQAAPMPDLTPESDEETPNAQR